MEEIMKRVLLVIAFTGAFLFSIVVMAQDKVVVVPLFDDSGLGTLDVQVIRSANPESDLCNTLFLQADCPSGYKVVGGSVWCGREGFTFSDPFRAVHTSAKVWGQEAWAGACFKISSPTQACAPEGVEAICIKLN
jgi:hypothetical protein